MLTRQNHLLITCSASTWQSSRTRSGVPGHFLHQSMTYVEGQRCACCGPAGSATARPKCYMPFAEGPRNCVGQSLAKMSLAATIATLLQTFTFRLADEVCADLGTQA